MEPSIYLRKETQTDHIGPRRVVVAYCDREAKEVHATFVYRPLPDRRRKWINLNYRRHRVEWLPDAR